MAGERAAAEIAPGLWRWTARHPAWHPDAEPGSPHDWDPEVGCVLFAGGRAAVFVDPLLPADEDSFWRWCDEAVGGRARCTSSPRSAFTAAAAAWRWPSATAARW